MGVQIVAFLILLSLKQSQSQSIFKFINDGQCFTTSTGALAFYSPMNNHVCAYKCLKINGCSLVSYILSNNTCLLYATMSQQKYASLTAFKPSACATWILNNWSLEGSVTFTQSGQWTVPAGVSMLKVLAVGGGGGGSCPDGGGGGSGFVNYNTFPVVPLQTLTITIGTGGLARSNGGSSVFGNNLLIANGGNSIGCSCLGGSGGSGGGAGCGSPGGSGGSGGSSGTSGGTSYAAGTGQGSSFTSYFSQFKLNTLSAGAGAAGIARISLLLPGGGGGGGVLINGAGPNAATGTCIISGVMCEPVPARGYGAGGNGASQYNGVNYEGAAGASGLIYMEYY